MLEDYEGINEFGNQSAGRCGLSASERDYIEEILPLHSEEALVDRIDELGNSQPPKAIDADRDIAEAISPVIEEISPIYLEAPSDSVQIEQAAESMENIEGLNFDEWKNLTFEERVSVLQKVENSVAVIAHRPACEMNVRSMEDLTYGYYSPDSHSIMLNSTYVKSDSYTDYKECLDTIIHEGRHAYQDYNLTEREVHPREGDLTNWKSNEFEYGYQDARTCGFKSYWLQPQECDARAFAEDVLNKYLEDKR